MTCYKNPEEREKEKAWTHSYIWHLYSSPIELCHMAAHFQQGRLGKLAPLNMYGHVVLSQNIFFLCTHLLEVI